MAVSGKNASFTFAGATYNADDCLQSWELTKSAEDISFYCNGYQKHLGGPVSAVFNASLALDATDTAQIAAIEEGDTGAWVGNPAGDVTGYIEFTSTRGTVIVSNVSAPMNGVVTMDVTIALDDITDTTAAT